MNKFLKILTCIIGGMVGAIVVLFAWWYLRPNRSVVVPELHLQSWDAVNDGWHNSNTDLVYWHDRYYMVYASSPYHFASEDSRLHLVRSDDARQWEEIAIFDAAGEDIRDPKFAPINGKLYLYALKNTEFTAEPYTTVYASSVDGVNWTPFQPVNLPGWLFWRPKSSDGITWYVPAYWHEHTGSALLASTDGSNWTKVADIHQGNRTDETDIEFLPDGRMLAAARIEYSDNYLGHPLGSTFIAVAAPPYTEFVPQGYSSITRLDGPNLFVYEGRIFAVGRYQPDTSGPFSYPGSILARKRTSLFEVQPEGLTYLSDLPSSGDTSYAGVVVVDGIATICYYTSNINFDYPWILGMAGPSQIRMARFSLSDLKGIADGK